MNTSRRCVAIVAMGTALACVTATMQVRPQFDLADVRASAVNRSAAAPTMQGNVVRDGVYRIQNATMVDLIRTAYGIDAENVLGGPSWLEWDRFDIQARMPPSTLADATRPMLQALLADRFALVLHQQSRPMPGLALRVPKAGAHKLKRADGSGRSGCTGTALYSDVEIGARRQAAIQAGENPVILQAYVHACRSMTMTAFVEGIRGMVAAQQYFDNGVLVDQTGLSGEWDFDLSYSQKPPSAGAVSGAGGEPITIFDAIDKQLGLKLEPTTIPRPVLVVDRVNRTPTGNPPGVSSLLPPPPPPAFDVASLRLSDPNAPDVRSNGPLPGGRFEVRNFPLRFLITLGWPGSELADAPEWLDSVRVDLAAKLPSTEATREIAGVMDINAFQPALRTLLIERFKVSIRTEQRPRSGYALMAAKPRLQKADPATRTKCVEGPGADGKDPRASNALLSRLVTCRNMTMQQFAEELPRLSRGSIAGQVLDATGVTGAYDFTLSFSGPSPSPAALAAAGQLDPGGAVTLFAALERQVGLKLEKRDIPVRVNVLEHIEQKPSDN
ncbi:MAG: TIGR03435 family protein [Vicinamibacterales bacterium]